MLLEVIGRARRRLLWNALAFQLAVAASVALGALVLLLLLGTDLVAGHWLVTLPLAYLAAGLAMVWRRRPEPCPTASLLDRHLQLPDTLSTAVFFTRPQAKGRGDQEFLRAQHEQATRIASGVDLRSVLPLRMPRVIYLSAALTMAATGLFVARYRSVAHLDLRAPVAAILQQFLENARTEIAKLVEELPVPKIKEEPQSQESDKPATASAGENADAKPSAAGESNPADGASSAQAAKENAKADTFAGEEEESQQGDQPSADSHSGSQRNASSQKQGEGARSQQQASGSQSASSTAGGSSMVNKIKDSLANLLSALKPPPGGPGGQQAMKAQEGRAAGNNKKQGATESGTESGDPGEGGSPKPGNAMAGGSGQAGKAQGEKQQGTGAGNNDGSKEIRAAQQLDAMGKLAMLYGKRAENVTGEFSVQAPPGPQNLITPYAQRAAEHTSVETTGLRDEVPVAFQEYVQHYYDLVRQEDASSNRRGREMALALRRPRTSR